MYNCCVKLFAPEITLKMIIYQIQISRKNA